MGQASSKLGTLKVLGNPALSTALPRHCLIQRPKCTRHRSWHSGVMCDAMLFPDSDKKTKVEDFDANT